MKNGDGKHEGMRIMKARDLDARVAENVMHLRVVAMDWPCGYHPDGSGYEATHFPSAEHGAADGELGSWCTDRGPVHVPEHGIWPPEARKGNFGSYAWVEPVPFYSTSITDAWEVVAHFRSQPFHVRCNFMEALGDLLRERFESQGSSGKRIDPFWEFMLRANTPEAICKAALAAASASPDSG